jgi:hypothetical protein
VAKAQLITDRPRHRLRSHPGPYGSSGGTYGVPLVVMARLARDVQTAVDVADLKHLIAQNHPRP